VRKRRKDLPKAIPAKSRHTRFGGEEIPWGGNRSLSETGPWRASGNDEVLAGRNGGVSRSIAGPHWNLSVAGGSEKGQASPSCIAHATGILVEIKSNPASIFCEVEFVNGVCALVTMPCRFVGNVHCAPDVKHRVVSIECCCRLNANGVTGRANGAPIVLLGEFPLTRLT